MTEFCPFSSLTEDLMLQVASFLPAKDLLSFQCASRDCANLNTDHLWRRLCETRWKPWPRFRLTANRQRDLEKEMPDSTWKYRYRVIEMEATRTELRTSDLQNLNWYLSFVLSGVRGESRSDFMRVMFNENVLLVPGHPPYPYAIRNEEPPHPSSHIPNSQRGDQPFSTKQWFNINDFPVHFITRKSSTAEWLIVNENVIIVSTGNSY